MQRQLWVAILLCYLALGIPAAAQTSSTRKLSGVIITQKNEAVGGVSITVVSSSGELKTVSEADGTFQLMVPNGPVKLKIEGMYVAPQEREIAVGDSVQNLDIVVTFLIPP